MAPTHIGAVTGANKGIGLAIVRQLALQYPSCFLSKSSTTPSLLIYLLARDKGRGEAAVRQLQQEKVLDDGEVTVKFHELDISDEGSIDRWEEFVRKEHPEGIDFVVNNAAVAMNGFDNNVVSQTLHTNYYGTLLMTEKLLPLLKPHGRLVNLASMSGHLRKFGPAIQKSFLDSKNASDVTALMQKFARDVEEGKDREEGWIRAAYATSKAGVIGMTRAVAYQDKETGSKKLINSCCPGYVATDMTRGGGSKTPDQGAQTPVMLAIGDIGERSGLFWQHERVIDW